MKTILRKAQEAKTDPFLALLDMRNTPTQGMTTSPVQRLFSRRIRTLLPTSPKLLQPAIVSTTERNRQVDNQVRQQFYYDRNATGMDELVEGDVVRIQPSGTEKTWKKAVVQRQVGIRSYEVKIGEDRIYRRNRKHLRYSHEDPPQGRQAVGTNETRPAPTSPEKRSQCDEKRTNEESLKKEVTTRSGRTVRQPAYLKD